MAQDDRTEQSVTEVNAGYVTNNMARVAQKDGLRGADRVSMAKDYLKWMKGGSPLHPSVVERKEKLLAKFQQVLDQVGRITGGAV